MGSPTEINNVATFLVVAEELNFHRSATRLNLDQSALTRRIQRLENALGFKLLDRTTRGVTLTPAGQSFYRDNAIILQRYEESVVTARRIADGKSGLLRISYMTFSATELMPKAVARYREAYPDVDISLRYMSTPAQKRALANGEVDVGYMVGPFEHTEFHSVLLSCEPLYVVVPPNHPIAQKQHATLSDLADQDLILGDIEEWGEYRWRLTDIFNNAGIALKVRIEASNTVALLGLVAAGVGITIYPKSLVGFLSRNVEVRAILHPDFCSQTMLVWKRSNRSAQLRRFIELAKTPPSLGPNHSF